MQPDRQRILFQALCSGVVLCSLLAGALAPVLAAETAAPAWRGATPGTAWWGPDRLWRCRDTLLFMILDEQGSGFDLNIDVRDMNIYMGGDSPVQVSLVDPHGNVLRNLLVEDKQPITDFDACDGINDIYLDLRYREWHRVHSLGGVPPGKTRSPILRDPAGLPAQTVTLRVPAAGAGLYRVLVVGSQDNWVALTPSRPLKLGVHGGPGPLYLNPSLLGDAWVYAPEGTKDVAVAIHEEELPSQWRVAISDAQQKPLGSVTPHARYTFTVLRGVQERQALKLTFSGSSPGAYLHLRGLPALVCPDAETAVAIGGGVRKGPGGRMVTHDFQRVMLEWAFSQPADAFAVRVEDPAADAAVAVVTNFANATKLPLSMVKTLLAAQDLDPRSPAFGEFDADVLKESFNFFNDPGSFLAAVTAFDHPGNPYLGNAAILRRVTLYKLMHDLMSQSAYFWYGGGPDAPATFKPDEEITALWDVVLRSNWYPLLDAVHAGCLRQVRDSLRWALPADVRKAWYDSLVCWAVGRLSMRQGECSNQWALGLAQMASIWESTREYTVFETLQHQVERICTPASLGRSNPDVYPRTQKSTLRLGGLVPDTGRIGAGVMAEAFGHDNEYNLETEGSLARVFEVYPFPEIVAWLDEYYRLKTHLTLPRGPGQPKGAFTDTCSPTDINSRTRYYTHKTGLSADLAPQVTYGPLWLGDNTSAAWPCQEEGSFLRNIDNTYYFVKTPAYYAIVFGGAANPSFSLWALHARDGNSFTLDGFMGEGYGQYQRKSTKISGISAIYAAGIGPTWLAANHNVCYANTVWGRLKAPAFRTKDDTWVDPTIVCSGFAEGELSVDETNRVFTRQETMEVAPLSVRRVTTYGDSAVDVTVAVTANEAVELASLYESLPVFADKRSVTLLDAPGATAGRPYEFAATSEAYGRTPPEHTCDFPSGEDASLPAVTCRAFAVRGVVKGGNPEGPAMTVAFDEPQRLMQVHPVRYRAVAAATASFSVPLPTTWAKGQTHALHYRILFGTVSGY